MKKLALLAAVLALFSATAAMFRGDRLLTASAHESVTLATSAAFRDGLYLGRLAAQRGGPMHIASGRWATAADRGLFVAGFQKGYHGLEATRARLVQGQ
jgi:hypothetical protein